MVFKIFSDVWKFGNVDSVGSGSGNIGAGKIAGVGFAGGKNFGDDDLMSQFESGGIIGESGFGTAIRMGLYDGPNSGFRVLFFDCLKRGGIGGGVIGVVVIDGNAALLTQ